MKTYTINCKTWRCGKDAGGDKQLGNGNTCLLNDQGSMCCLGQIALQASKKIGRETILNRYMPYFTKMYIPNLTYYSSKDGIGNTDLSRKAALINDNTGLTVKERMSKLRTLFKKKGIVLRFINQPK